MFLLVIAVAVSFTYRYKNSGLFDKGVDLIEMDARGYDGSNPLVILDTQLITKHFNIHTDLDFERLDYYEKFFEGFYEYFDREVFKITNPERLEVYLFNDLKYYEPFAKYLCGPNFTPYGFYFPGRNVTVINADTGFGVITHEIVHHFEYCTFEEEKAEWIYEGISTFFEKFIGHFDEEGDLHMTFGYFSNMRLPQTIENQDVFDLLTLFTHRGISQAHIRSFMMFLHKQGKFYEFARAVSQTKNDPYGLIALGQVYGRPYDEVAKEVQQQWEEWVRSLRTDNEVFLVEESFVKTPEEWDKWWSANRHRLYFSEDQQIYRVKEAHIENYYPNREDDDLGKF